MDSVFFFNKPNKSNTFDILFYLPPFKVQKSEFYYFSYGEILRNLTYRLTLKLILNNNITYYLRFADNW